MGKGKRRWNRERREWERGKEGGIGSGGDGKGEIEIGNRMGNKQ